MHSQVRAVAEETAEHPACNTTHHNMAELRYIKLTQWVGLRTNEICRGAASEHDSPSNDEHVDRIFIKNMNI